MTISFLFCVLEKRINLFFKKKPKSNALQRELRAFAHSMFLDRERDTLLNNEDLDILWDALCDKGSEGTDEERVG